jgi:hypothetical protein
MWYLGRELLETESEESANLLPKSQAIWIKIIKIMIFRVATLSEGSVSRFFRRFPRFLPGSRWPISRVPGFLIEEMTTKNASFQGFPGLKKKLIYKT